jgi:hypothetical protein
MTPLVRSALTALAVFGLSLAALPGHAGQHQNRVWSIGLIHVGLDHEPPSLPGRNVRPVASPPAAARI